MVDRYSDDDDIQASEKVGYTFPAITGGNESTCSPVPASVEFDAAQKPGLDLQSELELARQEIANLKKQLSNTAERSMA